MQNQQLQLGQLLCCVTLYVTRRETSITLTKQIYKHERTTKHEDHRKKYRKADL